MIFFTPTKYFITVGRAEGVSNLNAFDAALLSACIGNTNLVKISSILPPQCREVAPVRLPLGALVPTAYGTIASEEPGRIISAAVAIALPEDEDDPGLIMEAGELGPCEEVEGTVRRMAAEGMKVRGSPIRRIVSRSVEHKVEHNGAVVAAVVLWN